MVLGAHILRITPVRDDLTFTYGVRVYEDCPLNGTFYGNRLVVIPKFPLYFRPECYSYDERERSVLLRSLFFHLSIQMLFVSRDRYDALLYL